MPAEQAVLSLLWSGSLELLGSCTSPMRHTWQELCAWHLSCMHISNWLTHKPALCTLVCKGQGQPCIRAGGRHRWGGGVQHAHGGGLRAGGGSAALVCLRTGGTHQGDRKDGRGLGGCGLALWLWGGIAGSAQWRRRACCCLDCALTFVSHILPPTHPTSTDGRVAGPAGGLHSGRNSLCVLWRLCPGPVVRQPARGGWCVGRRQGEAGACFGVGAAINTYHTQNVCTVASTDTRAVACRRVTHCPAPANRLRRWCRSSCPVCWAASHWGRWAALGLGCALLAQVT